MRDLISLTGVLALSATALTSCTTTDAITDSSNDETSAPGSLDIWQAAGGPWHFHVVSGNKRIVFTSESYASRTSAIAGVLSTLDNGVDPGQYQVLPAAHGYLLHLVAANNQVIGSTETYASKSSAMRAITSCVRAVTSFLDQQQAITTGARVEIAAGAAGQFR